MLFYRTTRQFDGKRVENRVAIGLLKDFPEKGHAWAEVERLHLHINQVNSRRGITFGDLAQHYAEHELVDHTDLLGPQLILMVVFGCMECHLHNQIESLHLTF